MATIYYAFPNGIGLPVFPLRNMPDYDVLTGSLTLGAANDIVTVVGRIMLEGGYAGGTKTLSAAGGGQLFFRPTSSVFSNAGTTLRAGLQDVNSAGNQDGTYDVYADLVGGTDAIPSSAAIFSTPMEVGSKTVTHGDYLAVCFEFISRGGSDQVAIQGLSSSSQATPDQIPYAIRNTLRDRVVPYVCLVFDDGTVGWFSTAAYGIIATTSFNITSTGADEIGSVFKLPFSCKVQEVYASMSATNSSADFDFVLYADPLGSPSEIIAANFSAAKVYNSATRGLYALFDTLASLEQNVEYGLVLRPNNSNNIGIETVSFGSAAVLKHQTMLGADWSYISRLNASGPFTADPTKIAHVGLYANEIGLVGDISSLFT